MNLAAKLCCRALLASCLAHWLPGQTAIAKGGSIQYLSQIRGGPRLSLARITPDGETLPGEAWEIFDAFSESQTEREQHESFAWSPDGRSIWEYSGEKLSNFGGNWLSLHHLNAQQAVTVVPVEMPIWSPDSGSIAVLSLHGLPEKPWRRLEVVNPDSGKLTAITPIEPMLAAPAWPEAGTVSFYTRVSGRPSLVRLRIATQARHTQAWPFDPPVEMRWSPAQTRVAAVTQLNANSPYRLVVFAIDDSSLAYQTELHNAIRPRWSPDGRWLAFLSDTAGSYDIYLLAANLQSAPRRLTTGARRRATALPEFDWAPDSASLVYVSDRDGDRDLWRIDLKDGREQPLTQNTDDDFSPVWLPE